MNKILKANDNKVLESLAGNAPQSVDIMNQKMKTFGAQIAQNEERILRETCPVDLSEPENKARVIGTVDNAGIKTYAIDGQDFVRIYPPIIKNEFGGTAHKILATTHWEKLEPKNV